MRVSWCTSDDRFFQRPRPACSIVRMRSWVDTSALTGFNCVPLGDAFTAEHAPLYKTLKRPDAAVSGQTLGLLKYSRAIVLP